jgi:hypothetical protein
VSGGLVRKARDAVRRRRTELFTNVVAPSVGRLSLVRGFCVRACRALIERFSPQELTEHNRSQVLLNPRFARACQLRYAPLEKSMLDRSDLDWARLE